VEECDFDRQFLFGEYVAISHRYDLKRVSLRSLITVLSSYVKIELFSHVYDARQPVEFP
jgi:NO-binding membrane sensor protein with MHYT domain